MDVVRFAICNPVKVTVGVILLVLFGAISLAVVPIQLTPDVDRPIVTVRTVWPGRSPQEIEESILLEQEDKLKSIPGLWKLTSTAQLGRADIQLEFDVGVNVSRALQEVSSRLDEVPAYPDDVDRPAVRAAATVGDDSLAYLRLWAEDPEFEVDAFYDYAQRYLKPALERISGVAEIAVMGGRERQVQVRFDPAALAQRGISVSQLRSALKLDNVNESAGDLANGRQDVRFRVLGQFESLEPLRRTVVKQDAGGAPIRLEDVAEVTLRLEKKVAFAQWQGRTSMNLFVKREAGANVLEIMKQVRQRVEELNAPGGLLPSFKNDRHGLRLKVTFDDSAYIYSALELVRKNLMLGGCLAVIVLLLFLRSMWPTIMIAVAIPISVIGTFVIMVLTGRNLNVISLAGLCFAVGMVVDNAIVVLENIDRHLAMGATPPQAAYRATREVWGAILASTLTTIAVFGPVLTIEGEVGQLFYDIALAICAAVTLSLIVSVTVIPTAGAMLLRNRQVECGALIKVTRSLFGIAPLARWLCDAFSHLIYLLTFRSLSSAWGRILIVTVILVVALGISSKLILPANYLPNGNKNLVLGLMFTPPGYSLKQKELVGRRLEESVRPYWEAKDSREATAIGPLVDPQTGRQIEEVPAIEEFFFAVVEGRGYMIASSKDPENVRPVQAILARGMSRIPGSYGFASQRSIFGRYAGGSNSVAVEVVGNDLERLKQSASCLDANLREEFSQFSVNSEPVNYDKSAPERQMVIDQIRAKELGLNVDSLALAARALVDGAIVGDFTFEGDKIDLVIIRDPAIQVTPDELPDMPLAVHDNDGQEFILPLGELVHFVTAEASQSIRRVEQRRAITLTVNPPPDMALEEAQARIERLVSDLRVEGSLASDVGVHLSGNADKLSQVRTALLGDWHGWNLESLKSFGLSRLFLALLVAYLLMAALFESFLYPLVILFSVPLATVGGFVGLYLAHRTDPTQQMDTLTMLGFVILIGVVVNNAILLVHQALNFMRDTSEGDTNGHGPLPPREAIRESVRTRIRPIFMTTATSVFGMLPLVLAPGSGSELYRGLGAVVIGGLICATVFSLIVVPLVFSLVMDIKTFVRGSRRSVSET